MTVPLPPHQLSSSAYYTVIFTLSLGLSLVLTPAARHLALQTKFVDSPDSHKVHEAATPYLGGLAIWGACMVALLVRYQFLDHLAAWVAGGTILFLVGLWDDRYGMDPRVKFGAQILAASIPVVSGVAFTVFGFPVADGALTLFWIVGLTNAVNLLDNMDGLSAGTTSISCFFLFLIAAVNGQFLVAGLAIAIVGACLGFLRYNFLRPAEIFMGDAGSLFLGFSLAVACIRLRLPVTNLWDFLIPLLVVGLPILDTTTVTVLRMQAGRPVSLGGKDHCSHRLVALGFSPRTAVLFHYGLATTFGGLGLAASLIGPANEPARYAIVAGAGLLAVRIFRALAPVPVYGVNPALQGALEEAEQASV